MTSRVTDGDSNSIVSDEEMKASTLSSLLSSKAVNLFHPSSYHPRSFQSSKSFFTPLPCFSPATRYHNRIHLTRKLQFHTASSLTMASSFNPERARAPPAIAMPTPPVTKFKIGLYQLSVIPDKERNIAHARKAIEEAAEKGAQLVLLPEIWNSSYSNDSFPLYAEDIDAGGDPSPSTAMLSEVSRLLKIMIVGGSIPERYEGRLYNTCCVFGTDGKLKAKHRQACIMFKEDMEPDQKLVCVKQEGADEWDESMPLPGDIIKGFAEDDSDYSFVPVKAKSEFSSNLGKINSQDESIWLKVRRGYSNLKVQARVVQHKSSIIQKKYTIQAATDPRDIAELDELTLEQCTELQEMRRKVMDVENRGFRRSGIQYEWKMKAGMHLPDRGCSVVSSILFTPLEGENCVHTTTGRCMSWFCAAVSSRVPLTFVNIQTEKIAHSGFACIYSVIEGSAAERAGVRELFEETIGRGFLLVISRLHGKSAMPSNVSSEGLIHCCDLSQIKDALSLAIDRNDSIEMHIMAWPNQARLTRLQPLASQALLPPPSVFPITPTL